MEFQKLLGQFKRKQGKKKEAKTLWANRKKKWQNVFKLNYTSYNIKF